VRVSQVGLCPTGEHAAFREDTPGTSGTSHLMCRVADRVDQSCSSKQARV
jgi:hypothetical protein